MGVVPPGSPAPWAKTLLRQRRGDQCAGDRPRAGIGATIVAMSTEPLRAVQDHLSDVVDRVQSQHERVTITRNGRAAAILISPEDLAELEETLSVLSDP